MSGDTKEPISVSNEVDVCLFYSYSFLVVVGVNVLLSINFYDRQ